MRERLLPTNRSSLCKVRQGITRELHYGVSYVPSLLNDDTNQPHLPVEKKYHVDHFTCSVCPMLFGPQDSYYEHDNDVYCYYHYSTRFASKCAGCNTAILTQFLEINKTLGNECWHPECYMIHKVCGSVLVHVPIIDCYLKFWNVKVVPHQLSGFKVFPLHTTEPPYAEEERRETLSSLKEKQTRMEKRVCRIWT